MTDNAKLNIQSLLKNAYPSYTIIERYKGCTIQFIKIILALFVFS